MSIKFFTDYSEILQKIEEINPIKYARTRNYLNGSVTYLSPYLTHGVISLKQIAESILKNFSFEQSEKLIFELAWKEYFQRIWENKANLIFEDLKNPQQVVESHNFPVSVFNKSLGINALDHSVDNLYSLGYVHNHSRMWLSSVICNLGRYSWKLPAKWFYYHLLDGDLASNSLSWQWVCGTFSSKKYYANQDNLNKYSGFHQENTFLDFQYSSLPFLIKPEVLTQEIDEKKMKLFTDLNIENIKKLTSLKILSLIDLKPTVFVFHPWNLNPKIKLNSQGFLFLEKSHFNKFPISNNRLKFILRLAENLNISGIFIGEIEDLKNFEITTTYYPAIEVWQQIHSNINFLDREYLFPEISKFYPSFFSFWKQCLKNIKKNPSYYKYH